VVLALTRLAGLLGFFVLSAKDGSKLMECRLFISLLMCALIMYGGSSSCIIRKRVELNPG